MKSATFDEFDFFMNRSMINGSIKLAMHRPFALQYVTIVKKQSSISNAAASDKGEPPDASVALMLALYSRSSWTILALFVNTAE